MNYTLNHQPWNHHLVGFLACRVNPLLPVSLITLYSEVKMLCKRFEQHTLRNTEPEKGGLSLLLVFVYNEKWRSGRLQIKSALNPLVTPSLCAFLLASTATHCTSCSPGTTNLSWWKTVRGLWIRVKGHLVNCSPASLEECSWLSSSLSTLEHESLDLECLWRTQTHAHRQTGYMSKDLEWKASTSSLSGKKKKQWQYACSSSNVHMSNIHHACNRPHKDLQWAP